MTNMELEAYRQLAAKLQQTASTEVFEVGGYWPVLTALSVVSDDIGDAAGKILSGDTAGAAVHLGNANWVLACVANQYCCKLDQVQASDWQAFHSDVTDFRLDGSGDHHLRSVLLRLFIAFGRVTRIANRYEAGVLTDADENSSIANDIQHAQWAINVAIALCGRDAHDLLELRKSEVRSYRGKKKFVPGLRSDPSYGDSLDRFRALANVTMCPFAKTAKIWALGPWRISSTAKEFVAASEGTLNRFVRLCQPEGFDGIAIEATGISSLEDLKSRTNGLLRALGELSDRDPMMSPIEKKEWRFSLVGVDMFVTIFSSVYDEKH
ncbi:MAG: hypothetical protein HC794_08080, partial [Nitrospiraceae bacterium]|nr:hypothetical protein [Nitrospiraceae bacterium]